MHPLLFLTVSLIGLLAGCASLEGSPNGSEGQPSTVTVACTNSRAPEVIALLDWELRVSPDTEPIESGKPFTAVLDGTMVFPEFVLDPAQQAVPEGWKRFDLVDFKATVHVRSGTTGDDDVTLVPKARNYKCFRDGSPCDHNNDLPSVPGLVGNTDCEGETAANPCGRFIDLPISTDEEECVRLGKLELWFAHGFCVTGDLRVELEQEESPPAQYRADERGKVLFGWDDVNTGATPQVGGNNDATWNLPEAVYEEPIRSNGLRMTIKGIPVAFDCTMGVYSQGPHGPGSLDSRSSRTPDYLLISFPIE